jgi:hypothetical protein
MPLPIAPRSDFELRKQFARRLLDGLRRRQRGEQNQRVFDAGFLFGELEAHLERKIVVVLCPSR